MVLADYSGELLAKPPRWAGSRHAASAGVIAVLALCAVAAVVLLVAPRPAERAELASGHAGGLVGAALAAEKMLHEGITKLGRGPRSLQKTSLSAEMNKALAAVQELKGKLPTAAAADAAYSGAPTRDHGTRAAKGGRGRSARARASRSAAAQQAQDPVHKSLAKVRIAAQHAKTDAKVAGDMEARDNVLVRDELRKMVEVAKRLSGDMKKLPTARSAERAAERVTRKLGAVAYAARAMKTAAAEEEAARKRVVAHELEVRKQKLAEAEEEELAAARAAQEAMAAERLAVKKHNEAAGDEAAAHERRVAARRAQAIAARGEEGKGPLKEAAESPDALFPKEVAKARAAAAAEGDSAHVKSELDKYAPSKSAVAKGCIDTIATYGCGGLMADNPCLAFCGTENDVRRAARVRNMRKDLNVPVETGYAVHDRTGYFATGKDRDTYVDAVYGDEYDPKTYAHQRAGFFVAKNAPHSSLLAPEVESGGFSDVAADGQDREQERSTESMGSAQQVLRNEETLKRRLEGSLEQEQAQNSLLKQRLRKQESAMRDLSSSLAYVSGIPLDARGAGQSTSVLPNTPPLPRYKVDGSQELAQVTGNLRRTLGGVLLHNPSNDANSARAMHDPYRP